jgi:hypothetical protein
LFWLFYQLLVDDQLIQEDMKNFDIEHDLQADEKEVEESEYIHFALEMS